MKHGKKKKGAGYWAAYLALPAALILFWTVAEPMGWIKSYTFPSIGTLLSLVVEYAKDGTLWGHFSISLIRVLQGFFLALAAAFVIGMASALFPLVETATDLVIQILRPIPPIAWIPLAILWFGIGESSKVFIIFLGAFFPIFINILDGVKSIDPRYHELSEVYEVTKWEQIRHVILPGALPSIMTGIRVGVGNAWVCVVAAEMIGATKGVGYMLSNGRSLSRPDMVVLGMLIVGIVGKIMDDLLRLIRAKVITWQ